MKKILITTPIYYVNDLPHIGHAYTQLAADTLKRWFKLLKKDVFLLTGTDEHGSKIEKAALSRNMDTKSFVDEMSLKFKRLWDKMGILYDDYVRTTEEGHKFVVQQFFNRLKEKGYIYEDIYKGYYCVFCETHYTLDSGPICQSCGRRTDEVKERSYFFRLKLFKDRLLNFIETYVKPEFRKHEVINFVEEIRDVSITRENVNWGVDVPGDKLKIYVWFDALLNYISKTGYLIDEKKFNELWPADYHILGKEILRFHAIIWPAMLMAADLKLPKVCFAHGWITIEGKKMSKSLGNVIDPNYIVDNYTVDALRYYLFRDIKFGYDGDFSFKRLVEIYNSEVVDEYGNLVMRILGIASKIKFNEEKAESDLFNRDIFEAINKDMQDCNISNALEKIAIKIKELNKFINEKKLWLDTEIKIQDIKKVIYALKFLTCMLHPFLPNRTMEVFKVLRADFYFDDELNVGKSDSYERLSKPLFEKLKFV
ncbi:MAG: class I tRNA ligase family protein [bacterium]|nr:class I tRNA ligase family protein [bacterium]